MTSSHVKQSEGREEGQQRHLGGGEDWGYGGEECCTHCNGEGFCMDGADPLGNCPDEPHRCHACGGSGDRSDQRIF